MKEQEYLKDKIDESAEMTVDIDDTYKEKIKILSTIFKHAFGQSSSDFKEILDYSFYVAGVPEPESKGKLEKVLKNFITAIRYFTYLGMDEEKINRQLSNFGITINRTSWSPVGGEKTSSRKYIKAWKEEYPNEDPMDIDDDLLKFLLHEGIKIKSSILDLQSEVKAITDAVEEKCEVTKGNFKRGVNIKATSMKGKDVGEKIAKIEKSADEFSLMVELLEG